MGKRTNPSKKTDEIRAAAQSSKIEFSYGGYPGIMGTPNRRTRKLAFETLTLLWEREFLTGIPGGIGPEDVRPLEGIMGA